MIDYEALLQASNERSDEQEAIITKYENIVGNGVIQGIIDMLRDNKDLEAVKMLAMIAKEIESIE